MSSALERVARELEPELTKHGIVIQPNQLPRYAEWQGIYVKFTYGTTSRECRRKLKKLIKAAEAQQIKDSQESLL